MSDKAPDAFRTISEVADELDLPQHVLRFWESKFAAIRPMKRGGGRRYYRPADVDLLRGIRFLLYSEGYTIKGVQKILKEQGIRHVMGCWADQDDAEVEDDNELAETEFDDAENEEFESYEEGDEEEADEDDEEEYEDDDGEDSDQDDDEVDEDEDDDDIDASADFVPESPLRPQQRIPLRSAELRGGGLSGSHVAKLREALAGLREAQNLLNQD